MARNPQERYPSALALAEDIEHWLADEPVEAWREPVVARLGRWARRHRTSVAAAVALLFTAVVALAASTVLVGIEQRQTEEARRQAEANAALAQTRALDVQRNADEVERQKRVAEKLAQRAEANFQRAKDAVDQLLTEVGELRDVAQMDRVRRNLLEKALTFYQGFLKERSDDPDVRREAGRAYLRIGTIYQTLGE